MKANKTLKNKELDYIKKELDRLKHIELKYNTLLNATPDMAWFTDIDSNYQDVNEAFINHCGKDIEDIKGNSHKYVWKYKIGNECIENDLSVIRNKESMMFEEIVPGKCGYKHYYVYRTPVINENNEVIGIVAVTRDVTEIENIDTQLKILIEHIPFRVWLCDKNGTYIKTNSQFAKSKQVTAEELIGKNIRDFYTTEEVKEIVKEDMDVFKSKKNTKFTKEIIENGELKSVEVYKTPVIDISNEVSGIVGTLVDITKIKEAEKMIKEQAYTDAHTGLLNRRSLYEFMESIEVGNYMTTIIMDVDNFKLINDKYGHYTGDRVLINIAEILVRLCKKDNVFRFGGDEFIIVFKDKFKEEEIVTLASEIIKEVSSIELGINHKENIGISMGIAYHKQLCDKDKYNMITKADTALYKAKQLGKNRFILYTKGLEEEVLLKVNIEKDLKLAIKRKEITLLYQPQYTINNKLRGFEALFRWNREKYNNIPIIDIIKIMEESKLILNLGYEIIKKACVFANNINLNRSNKLIVSINISSVQIMDEKFIDNIKDIFKETKVDTSYICIEITETVLLENINENIDKLKKLRDLGIKISLDDFGTGYSSFNYLIRLPLSEVKIDKIFVMSIEEGDEYKKLIKLIVDSSHSLNLDIVAEGVETKEQLTELKEIGVDYVQGYLMSKPLIEEDALNLICNQKL